MTKAALEAMIAALKDRCKTSMNVRSCGTVLPSGSHSLQHPSQTPSLCYDQVISLTALIAYVANATGKTEYRIERELSNHFCIPNPKCLPQHMYDQAVKYMVEQVPHSHA